MFIIMYASPFHKDVRLPVLDGYLEAHKHTSHIHFSQDEMITVDYYIFIIEM